MGSLNHLMRNWSSLAFWKGLRHERWTSKEGQVREGDSDYRTVPLQFLQDNRVLFSWGAWLMVIIQNIVLSTSSCLLWPPPPQSTLPWISWGWLLPNSKTGVKDQVFGFSFVNDGQGSYFMRNCATLVRKKIKQCMSCGAQSNPTLPLLLHQSHERTY